MCTSMTGLYQDFEILEPFSLIDIPEGWRYDDVSIFGVIPKLKHAYSINPKFLTTFSNMNAYEINCLIELSDEFYFPYNWTVVNCLVLF